MADTMKEAAERLRMVLADAVEEGAFAPQTDWEHLGLLVDAMEQRGYFLMLSSVHATGRKRMAAFHVTTASGFPCAGSSEWGAWETIGEAVVAAAEEALFRPREGSGAC